MVARSIGEAIRVMKRRHSDERRDRERRLREARMGERGMRCEGCGTVWYSAIADITAQWATCFTCGGKLHLERRTRHDRRNGRARRDLAPGT
jgi:acetyl-CoA carboxylase beta subunit